MLTVKRYHQFEESKNIWHEVEQQSSHYPFQEWWYQNLFAKNFSVAESIIILAVCENEKPIAIAAFEKVDSSIQFLGTKHVLNGQDITDFGDILIDKAYSGNKDEIWATIVNNLRKDGSQLELKAVREDSVTFTYFKKKFQPQKTETSPYILLPESWDGYLQILDKKDRHELERKIRKLERQVTFELCKEDTIENEFKEFVRLHRLSDGDKAQFMTEGMKDFFWQMLQAEKTTWQTHLCSLTVEGKKVASVFLFISEISVLLYNSAFDPNYRNLSVGLLIHAFLIKKSILEKKKIYDFLRGNERYKYDLGAKDLLLYTITIPL